jgi:hypothetical protein
MTVEKRAELLAEALSRKPARRERASGTEPFGVAVLARITPRHWSEVVPQALGQGTTPSREVIGSDPVAGPTLDTGAMSHPQAFD